MAIITQNYDIDLKATGEYPVVKMSQFDTGSRTIVFTVYDGHDLAQIDGMVARVDGTRSDGVEFSSTCTVGTGSKVSFTISQEMTKVSGKHTAELVIFDAEGNPIGTQNFLIEVETATMMRDSAASADDRTLYDQFTGSVSKTVADKMASVDSKLAGVDDKMAGIDTQISTRVDTEIDKRIKPDPLRGAWSDYTVDGTVNFAGDGAEHVIPLKIKSQSNGADAVYGSATENAIYIYKPGVYQMTVDGFYAGNAEVTNRVTVVKLSSNSDTDGVKRRWALTGAQGIGTTGGRSQIFRGAITFYVPDDSLPYRICMYTNGSSAVSLTSGSLSQVVVTRISSGGDILEKGVNTLKVGKTTTGAPGTQASVVNSGTANDVVLDFTIPKGAKGDKGDKGDVGLPALVVKKPLINEYPVGDTFTWNVSELLNRTPLVNEYSTALSGNGKYIIVWQCVSQSDSQFTGKTISRQSIIGAQGPKGDKGDTGPQGAKGDTGARGNRIYLSSYEALPNTGSHQWTDLTPVPSVANPPIVGDFLITPAGNLMPITGNKLDPHSGGGGRYDVGGILINLKGRKGDKGDKGEGVYTLPAATATTLGGIKIGAGINVSADGTIDVQGLVDRISQMQSKYDALISSATYEVGSGLTKGAWYDDYTWKFCRLRVVGGVCTLSFSASRKSAAWNAKAWNSAHVLTLPEGLGSLGEVHMPIVTNANSEPNNNTALQVQGNEVAFRPTVDTNYGTGTWFEGTVSWVAAGSQS